MRATGDGWGDQSLYSLDARTNGDGYTGHGHRNGDGWSAPHEGNAPFDAVDENGDGP